MTVWLIAPLVSDVSADGVPWGSFSVATGGWLLVTVFVVAILRGKLVPRSSLDDARKVAEDTAHDRDQWRAESRIKDAQITEKDEQLRHLAEVGETEKAVLNALSRLTEGYQQ